VRTTPRTIQSCKRGEIIFIGVKKENKSLNFRQRSWAEPVEGMEGVEMPA